MTVILYGTTITLVCILIICRQNNEDTENIKRDIKKHNINLFCNVLEDKFLEIFFQVSTEFYSVRGLWTPERSTHR